MSAEKPLFPDASDNEIVRRFNVDRLHIDVIRECFGKAALSRALEVKPVTKRTEEQPDAA